MKQDDETRNLADQNELATVGSHFPAKEEKRRSAGAIRVARHRQKKRRWDWHRPTFQCEPWKKSRLPAPLRLGCLTFIDRLQ